MMIKTALVLMGSYIVGSVPTSFLAGKILKGIDIRNYGSGNVGATNVHRVLGLKAAISVVFIDVFKGALPIFILSLLHDLGHLDLSPHRLDLLKIGAGMAVVVGHLFPVFLGFKGGKGVATSSGVFIGLSPISMLIVLAIFFVIVILTRYVSVGSIVGALLLPILISLRGEGIFIVLFAGVTSALVILKHIPNIKRLLRGTEYRFGERVNLD